MKNTLLVITLMIGLLFTMAIGYQVTASQSSCPEYSGSGTPLVVEIHPVLVSGIPQDVSVLGSGHPELVSGTSQEASVLGSDPSAELISAGLPSTTISASVSSSIVATVDDAVPVSTGNFFTNNWGALLMGLLGFADLVARLTPSVKDNSILNFLSTILNAIIPNLKKGGGQFTN